MSSCLSANISSSTDSAKYIVKIGNGYIKKIDDTGDVLLTLSWKLAKSCDDLTHAQSCAETYGGTVYQITYSVVPVSDEEP